MKSLFKNQKVLFLTISLLSYLVFFYPLLNSNTTIYSGKDTTNYHYPNRYYLYEKLMDGQIPYWTERIFAGFPIYADIERGFLHPVNIGATYIFGPIASYKLIHVSFYLLGSWGLYKLLTKKKIGSLGFSVANMAYFFSFYNLYHQQHFSIVLATYLLPLIIYLTDEFLEKERAVFIWLILGTVFQMVYFGNLQTVLIVLLGQFLYVISYKSKITPSIRNFYLTLGILGFAISLPLLIPAVELLMQSARGNLTSIEGSFNSLDLLNIGFPFTYGSLDNYFGTSLFGDHLKHETYIYFGISTLILGYWGYLRSSNQIQKFTNLTVSTFLILAFIRYVPILNSFIPPPFSLFRYWGRVSILLVFAFSMLAAIGIERLHLKVKHKFEPRWIRFWMVLMTISAFIWLLEGEIRDIFYTLSQNFSFDLDFVTWLIIGTLTLLLLRHRDKSSNAKTYLVMILLIDVVYFGKIVTANDFMRVTDLFSQRNTSENTRVVVSSSAYNANMGLYFPDWGLFGYTPLVPEKYRIALVKAGAENERTSSPTISSSTIPRLEALGVQRINDSRTRTASLIKNKSVGVTELLRNEGAYTVEIQTQRDTEINTFIRNYSDWIITVDGDEVKSTSTQSDLFLQFPLDAGNHLVKFAFVPKALKSAIVISVVIILGTAYYIKDREYELFKTK